MVRRRGKVELEWIRHRPTRERSLKMRLPNLVKKTRELSVLCGVPACLVVYVPGKDQPEVWPSQEAAADVLVRYSAVEESQRLKYKLDGEDFVRKMVEKKTAKLYDAHRQNCEKEINLLVVDFLAGRRGSFADLPPNVHASLEWYVEKKLQAVNARLQEIRGGAILPPPPAQLQLVPFEQAPAQPPSPPNVQMVKPLAMLVPPPRTSPVHVTVTVPQLHEEASDAPMTLDGEPRHGSYLFEVLDACNGSGLPTTEELRAVFVKAGITAPLPNPYFDDPM